MTIIIISDWNRLFVSLWRLEFEKIFISICFNGFFFTQQFSRFVMSLILDSSCRWLWTGRSNCWRGADTCPSQTRCGNQGPCRHCNWNIWTMWYEDRGPEILWQSTQRYSCQALRWTCWQIIFWGALDFHVIRTSGSYTGEYINTISEPFAL